MSEASMELSQQTLRTALETVLYSRRSIRRYQVQPIPSTIIEAILQAAIYAPSAHNRQPWRFTVITHLTTKEKLALAMGQRLRDDLTRDQVSSTIIEKDVARSYSRITSASALILVAMSMQDMDKYPDPKREQAERMMAIQSTAMAVQNLLLTAHAYGLGACWICAPLFCPDVVSVTLTLPTDWEPQALITMGYPAEEKQANRHSLEKSILWR